MNIFKKRLIPMFYTGCSIPDVLYRMFYTRCMILNHVKTEEVQVCNGSKEVNGRIKQYFNSLHLLPIYRWVHKPY